MQKDIINFIKKQGGVFSASKFFGGLGHLLKYAENDTQLYKYILKECSGEISFISDSGKRHKFNIIFTKVDVENLDAETLFLYVFVDLKVKNKEKEFEIGQWVQSYMDDQRVNFVFEDKELRKFHLIYGIINSVNGNLYNIEREGVVPPDEKIEPFLNENVLTYIQKLQNLFD